MVRFDLIGSKTKCRWMIGWLIGLRRTSTGVPDMAFFTSARRKREPACRQPWRGGGISPCALSPNFAPGRNGAAPDALPAPPPSELAALSTRRRRCAAANICVPKCLVELWREIGQALETELAESGLSLRDFLKNRNRRWRLVGRVHFNLAENRRDPEFPFAFMATYTSSLSANGELRHQPLGQALREYAGAGDKAKLLQLLKPVQEAAEACSWLKMIVDSGEIFHPLRWEPAGRRAFSARCRNDGDGRPGHPHAGQLADEPS